MPYADVDGTRLWFETAGTGGTPVVLVMGLGFPGAAWAPQVPALAQEHRVLFFDHRGIGRSEKAGRIHRIETLAADTLGLIDHLGWERAHVAGISMGGLVALELALAARTRLLSLTLISSYAGGGVNWFPCRQAWRWVPQTVLAKGRRRIHALQRQLLSADFLSGVDRQALGRDMAAYLGARAQISTLCAQMAGVLLYDARKRLAALDGLPVLIVQAGRDVMIPPRKGEELRRLAPGARLVTFPGAGHGVTLEKTEEVNRLLLEHFRAAEASLTSSLA